MRYNSQVKSFCQRRGFTLIEILISLAIFAAVVIAVGAFQVSVFKNDKVVRGSYQTAQDTQVILKTILTEIRSSAPGANGAYTIASAGTSSLSFFYDKDGDGKTEKIGYNLLSGVLYRTSIPPTGTPLVYLINNQSTTTVMWNVSNATSTPVFQYFDQNYTGTSSPMTAPIDLLAVRLIKVNLTLDVDPKISPVPRTYTVQINLRNLKTNL